MRGVIGRGRRLSPRSARRSTPGGAGACYNFLYCIKAGRTSRLRSGRDRAIVSVAVRWPLTQDGVGVTLVESGLASVAKRASTNEGLARGAGAPE